MPVRLTRPVGAVALVLTLGASLPILAQVGPGTAAAEVPSPGAPAPTDGAAALTVVVASARQEIWPVSVPASGWLEPWAEAVIAAEVAGVQITAIHAELGQQVEAGEVLAELSTTTLAAELRRRRAVLTQAQAAYDEARRNADRARSLGETGAVSRQETSQAIAAEAEAEANLAAQEASVEAAEIDLSHGEVRAIDDGVIASVSAELGAVPGAGAELFRLIRQGRIEWRAEVSPRFLPQLREGLTAIVDTPVGPVEGRVRLVGPTVDQSTGRILVHVDLPPEVAGIRPRAGIFASGRIVVEERPALTLPQTAIVLRDGFSYVMAVAPDRTVEQMRVETGRRSDDRVEIVSGLGAGNQVVQAGGAFLSDDVTVRVAGAPPAAPSPASPAEAMPDGLPPAAPERPVIEGHAAPAGGLSSIALAALLETLSQGREASPGSAAIASVKD